MGNANVLSGYQDMSDDRIWGRPVMADTAQAAIGFRASLSARSLCKHLLEHAEDFRQSRGREPPQTTHQTLAIYRANLIENNVSGSSPKSAWNSKWVGMASCRERSDNKRPQIRVELVRRDDHTRASLADFATPR